MAQVEVTAENAEATEAWNGPLFDVWSDFEEIVVGNARVHGDAALATYPPSRGARVLDVGCGLGDSTVQIARLVGEDGHAHGVDVAERMIERARADADEQDIGNVSFEVLDVQAASFAEGYDYAFARFGTMFFANPVAALRNVRAALVPGGRLNMVVWRSKLDNEWIHRAELIVEQFLDRPDDYDEPTCGPGPFSMANADTVTDIMRHAGFEQITLTRNDLPLKIGHDLQQAVELVMSIGPAGEVLRLWGDRVDEIRPKVEAALLEGMADFATEEGAIAASSTWSVSGVAPAA